MKSKRQSMATNRLKTLEIFGSLFPRSETMIDTIANHMNEFGYDKSEPIILWDRSQEEGRNALYIVDGHTRKCAAVKAGLSEVYVALIEFLDEGTALQYAIRKQRDRRNITDADLMRCIQAVDNRKKCGGDRKSKAAKSKTSSEVIDSGKSSAQETADMVGTSKTKVEKARTVIDHADDKIKQEVKDGKKSIHQGYKETQTMRKESGLINGNPISLNSVIKAVTKQMDKITLKISEQREAANNIKIEVYQALMRSYEDLQDEMVKLEAAVDVEAKRRNRKRV